MTQTEKIIIDMSQASKHDIYVLAQNLTNVSAVLSAQGLKLQIKKLKSNVSASLVFIH